MEFRILGPIEVLDAGRILPLGGSKQRAALAVLLLHPNEVVSRDRLIEGLWGASPPATAGHTLDTYMSRLRRVLASEGEGPRVVTRRPGYSLRVEEGELDLERFEILLEDGRQALRAGNYQRADVLLREGLGLFRGPPLDDLAHASFAQSEAGHLDELPLAALEERIEADLALGRHLEILPELRGLVTTHPFRERFWGQLMLALYRSGRQADGLQAFERARHHLADELGVDPGPALQSLHEDILRQAPQLDLQTPSHAAAPSLARIDLGSPERATPLASPSAREAIVTKTEQDTVILAEGPEPRVGNDGRTPPARLLRRGWARAALAIGIVVALAVAVLTIIPRGRSTPEEAAIKPGVNLLDAHTGEVVGQFPSILAGEMWYANGVFWALTLTPEGTSISFVGIDARTRQVVAEFATGLDDVGDFAVHGHELWVSEFDGPTLLRMAIPSGRIVQQISLADPKSSDTTGSYQVVAGAGSIWVARPAAREIVRVDASTGRIQKRYAQVPPGCCMAFGAGRLWFDREGGVGWLDARTGEFGPLIQASGANLALGGGFAWITNMETGAASKISPQGTVVATYTTGEGADKVSYNNGTVWVANSDTDTVTGIDTVTGALRSYRMGHLVGAMASGDGVVAVMVGDQQSYDEVLAGLEGNVARILLPAYFTATQEPAVTDVTSNPLMAQIEEATCAKLLNYPDIPASDGWRLQPEIATSMPAVSNGRRTFTFTVGSGYRFSPPSNQPVTANVLRDSIERALSPGLGSGAPGPMVIGDIAGEHAFREGTAEHISGLRAAGDRLTITLTRPSQDFLERLALPYFCPVPTDTPIVPDGTHDVAPPSAGPYYMALPRINGEIMILKRNPNYTGPRPHFFDAFAIREGIDPAEAVGRVEQGTWDGVTEVNQHVADNPVVDDPAFAPGGALDRIWGDERPEAGRGSPSYWAATLPSADYLAFNASRPLFSERQARLAVALAFDRSALAATRGEAPMERLLPPAMEPLWSTQTDPPGRPELRRARALLGDEQRLAVMGVLAHCGPCLLLAEAVKAQLRPVGITVKIKEMDDVYAAALARAPVDLVERVTALPYPDGASFIAKMLRGDVPAGWLPADVGSKTARVGALGGRQRGEAATRLADELARNEVPVAVFAHGSIGELFSARIGCIQPQPFGTGVDLAALCLNGAA